MREMMLLIRASPENSRLRVCAGYSVRLVTTRLKICKEAVSDFEKTAFYWVVVPELGSRSSQ